MGHRESQVRVAVADDHPLYRVGVARAIEASEACSLVGVGTNAAQALDIADAADVLVLDWTLSEAPEDLVRNLLTDNPDLRVVVISATDEAGVVAAALDCGAIAFVPKTMGERDLLAAIAAAARGDTYIPPSFGARLFLTRH